MEMEVDDDLSNKSFTTNSKCKFKVTDVAVEPARGVGRKFPIGKGLDPIGGCRNMFCRSELGSGACSQLS